MSCIGKRTRRYRSERLTETYGEMKNKEDSSGSNKGESTNSPPFHNKTIVPIDDSDKTMSSDSSSSETNNSDDDDFDVEEDSDRENSHSDDSSSETDEDGEQAIDNNGRDCYNSLDLIMINYDGDEEDDDIKEIVKDGRDDYVDNVIVIDDDDDDVQEIVKDGRDAEKCRSSEKFKGHRDGRKVLKLRKVPAKERVNGKGGKRDIDARIGKICNDDDSGKEHSEKKVRGRKKSKNIGKKKRQVVNILVESIVHGSDAAQDEATEQVEVPPSENRILPLKFRFYDEDEIEPEQDETELECEKLFAELDFELMDFKGTDSGNPELEDEVEDYPKAKPNAETICSEEGHDTYLHEEIGLICNRCNKLVTEIKDITPSFGKDPKDASERRRYISGQDSVFDKFDFRGSEDNGNDLRSRSYGTVWSLIPGIRKNMYPHQQEGFEFLWKNMAGTINLNELKKVNDKAGGGCIISHAPGTGKTRLTIIFLQTYLKLFPQCYPVIIAPAGMLLTWEEEFKKWNFDFPFHNLNNNKFSGKESEVSLRVVSSRKHQDTNMVRLVKLASWSQGKSVLGISYHLFDRVAGERYEKNEGKKKKKVKAVLGYEDTQMRKVLLERPGLVVMDEGHTPRNKNSRIWNSCLDLQSERRIILSGTPFQNSFDQLFNTLELVRPSLALALDNKLRFSDVSRPSTSKKRSRDEEASGKAVERLKATIEPFVHVHKGSILQESLPGLRECVILLNPPQLQKKLIKEHHHLQKEEVQGTFDFDHKEAMVSVHPSLCLVNSSLMEKEKLEKLRLDYDEGAKSNFTTALIRISLSKPEKEKVIVFSQFLDPLNLIKDQLIEHGYGSNEVLLIRGYINQKTRKTMIDKFNDPTSAAKVMLASTKCCSEGINLVGASRVVLLDVAWNPSVESQAISRAFRLGQNRVVYTYHLMTSGTTEVDKYCRQVGKGRLSELVFAPTDREKRWKRRDEINDDMILEKMVENEKLKGMFEKIILQPKEKNLRKCFGLVSYPGQL